MTLTPKTELHDLVDAQSNLIFDCLQISKGWLEAPVSEWPRFEEFKSLESFASNLVVVNDTAEQGCNLATTHGGILTQDEVQQQHIFHGVQDNRHRIPKITKKNLNLMRFYIMIY